jgi:hypothetical protein
MRGKDITIPKGTEITAYIDGAVYLATRLRRPLHRDPEGALYFLEENP